MINQDPDASDSPLPRIAMVSTHGYVAAQPSLGEADTGGQVIYVLELSKKLAERGYAVDIFTRRFKDQKPLETVAEDVRIVRIPCGGNEFIPKEYLYEHSREWVENTLEFIQKNRLSYEFINSHYWDAGVFSQELSDQLGVPHVFTPHSLGQWKLMRMREEYEKNPQAFENKYNFTNRIEYEKNIFRDSFLVTATSSVQADIISEDYGIEPKKIKVIPPGYDENRFFPLPESKRKRIRERAGIDDKKVIVTLGRLAYNKGYDLLIDAFEQVAKREPKAELHMAVGGNAINEKEQNLLTKLKEQAERLKLTDRIKFDSFIPDEELADYYRIADVFVLSSRYEPFGMTAVEAMACGTPSVITTHGGLWREMKYGVNCLFADVMDKEDLGITISKILQYPELKKRLSQNGLNKVRNTFTWTKISQHLIDMVKKNLSLTKEKEKVVVPK